jgi:hypothetical protein
MFSGTRERKRIRSHQAGTRFFSLESYWSELRSYLYVGLKLERIQISYHLEHRLNIGCTHSNAIGASLKVLSLKLEFVRISLSS